ncbi:MAG: diaminopimelate epimerase [Candidatus Thorarchaeota archaeon]
MKFFKFEKYHNLGNDFVIIDDRDKKFSGEFCKKDFCKKDFFLKNICRRNFSIGADGVIILQKEKKNYRMKFFNSDGSLALFCGNALLCLAKFLYNKTGKKEFLVKTEKKDVFLFYEGKSILKMELPKIIWEGEVLIGKKSYKGSFVDSGAPHFVIFKKRMPKDIFSIGRKIRENKVFMPEGTNVSFSVKKKKGLFIRTYEKGVEEETFACGSAALASSFLLNQKKVKVYFQNKYFQDEHLKNGHLKNEHSENEHSKNGHSEIKSDMEVFFDKKAHLISYPRFVYEGVYYLT